MAKAYRGRYCTRFYCDKVRERRCCADCWRRVRRKCRNACQNDPSRCGLQNKAAEAARGGCKTWLNTSEGNT